MQSAPACRDLTARTGLSSWASRAGTEPLSAAVRHACHGGQTHLSDQGTEGENKDNVEAYLNALPVYQERQYRPARAKITESVQKALQVYGYYQPKITLSRDKKAPAKVIIEVEPGKPVIISRLDILLEGDASSDELYSELLDKLPLKEGILNHGKYESIKADLGSLGLARGYFDAKISKSQVKVFPDQGTAEIYILFRSGPRYHFGGSTTMPRRRPAPHPPAHQHQER